MTDDTMARIHLDELERRATAALVARKRHDDAKPCTLEDDVSRRLWADAISAHREANGPRDVLALIARIRELEAGRDRGFIAGWNAGWDATGEQRNGKYTRVSYTKANYEAERSEALAAWLRRDNARSALFRGDYLDDDDQAGKP